MSSEKPSDREVIDNVTKRQIDSGVRPDIAHQRAIESMRRVDRQRRDGFDGERRR